MDRLRDFLEAVRTRGVGRGNFRGLLHALIGRRITRRDGTEVSGGLTWREVAVLLRDLRWDTEAVRDLGLDPGSLPARDRQRFWYGAITQAEVSGPEARAAADRLAGELAPLGYALGPPPGEAASPSPKKGRGPRKKGKGK